MFETIIAGVIVGVVLAVGGTIWRRWSGSADSNLTTLSLSIPPPAGIPPQPAGPPDRRPPQPQEPRETAVWEGRTFLVYEYPSPQNWFDTPGLYVLARRNPESDQKWTPVLVGVAGSFATELREIPRGKEARERGATHLHVHKAEASKALRTFRESFVEKFQPQMNIEATTVGDSQMTRDTLRTSPPAEEAQRDSPQDNTERTE